MRAAHLSGHVVRDPPWTPARGTHRPQRSGDRLDVRL